MPDDHGRERNLIRSKLFPPQPPSGPVVRARLLDRLNEASVRPITLISAPAGYGKTTLAVQWLPRCPWKAAWICIDPADNDPERFLRYLVGAMRTVLPDCLPRSAALLDAASRPPWSYLSETLVSELGELHERVVLVFDDWHAIVSDPVRELVRDLVESLAREPRRVGEVGRK